MRLSSRGYSSDLMAGRDGEVVHEDWLRGGPHALVPGLLMGQLLAVSRSQGTGLRSSELTAEVVPRP